MSFLTNNSSSKRVLYLNEQSEELEKARDHIAILNAEKNTLKRMVQELLQTQEVQLLLTQEETASLQLSRSPSQKSAQAIQDSPPVTSSREGSLKLQNLKNVSQSSFSNRHQQLLEKDKAAERLKHQQKELAYDTLVEQLGVLKQTVQQLEQSNKANVKLLSMQNEKMQRHEQLKKDVTSLLHDLGQMQAKIEDVEKEKEDLKHQFALKNELISNLEAENAEIKQIVQILSDQQQQNIQNNQNQFDEDNNHQLQNSQVIQHNYQFEQHQRHQQSSQQLMQSQSQPNIVPDNIHSELSIQKEIFKRFIFGSQHAKKKGLQEIFNSSFQGLNRFEELLSQGRLAEVILGLLRFNNDLMGICYHGNGDYESGYSHTHKNSSPRQFQKNNREKDDYQDKKKKKKNDQHSPQDQQQQQDGGDSEVEQPLKGKEESQQQHKRIPQENQMQPLQDNLQNQTDNSAQQQQQLEHQQLLRQLKVVEQQLELSKQQQELQQSIHQQLQSSIQMQQFNQFALQQQAQTQQQYQQQSPMNPLTKPFQQNSVSNSVRSSLQQHEYQQQQQLISFSQDNLAPFSSNLLQKPQFSSPSPQDYTLNKAKPTSGYSSPMNILFQDFPGSQTASPDPSQFMNAPPQGNIINAQRFSLENAGGQMEKNRMINQPKVVSNLNIKLENIATTTSDNLIEESNHNNGKNNMNKNGNGYEQDDYRGSFREKSTQNGQNNQEQGYQNDGMEVINKKKKREGDVKSQMKQNKEKHHSDIEDLDRQLEMMRAEEQGQQQYR